MGITVVAAAKLHHAFTNHYQPLADAENVDRIIAIRPVPWSRSSLRNITVVHFGNLPLPIALCCMVVSGIRWVVRERASAVVAFTPLPYGLIGLLIARLTGRPLHVGIINEVLPEDFRGIAGFLRKVVLRNAGTISVSGEGSASRVREYAGVKKNVFLLPHGVGPEFRPAATPRFRYDAIFVGDLLPVKRVSLIVRAWRLVVDRVPAARLCIVGQGPEEDSLRGLVTELGLGNAVEFVGYQSRVHEYLQAARIIVMASRSEGLPFALIEAMACGLVPVVNDVGNIGRVVKDGENGILLKRTPDPTNYADGIVTVLRDEEMRKHLAENARKAVDGLDHAEVSRRWERIIDCLCGADHGEN
jgi:glycosyltransferase involved in cell wall biosynthesis